MKGKMLIGYKGRSVWREDMFNNIKNNVKVSCFENYSNLK